MSSPAKLIERLPDEVPEGPAWLVGLRRAAIDGLRETGFPTSKTEAWRHTSVRKVVDTAFAETSEPVYADWTTWLDERFGEDGADRIVLVDGRPVGELLQPEGVKVSSLAAALDSADGADLEGHLGAHALSEHFAALNAALFSDGVLVRVARDVRVARPLHIIHIASAAAANVAAYPRVLVLAAGGSELNLVESYCSRDGQKNLVNAVTEIHIGENAQVEHTRELIGADTDLHLASLSVHQERDSRYRSHVSALGGGLGRLDLRVLLAGQGADCSLEGVYHADRGEHVDHHVYVDHRAAHCNSRIEYRGILDGTGNAVFDAITVVRRSARETSASQANHNLLLSDDATVNTKPHLEIDTDSVQCSHGATIGALEEAQLFYLRARGIGSEQAEAILTYGFVRQLVDEIPNEAAMRRLGAALLDRLPHGETIAEIL